MRKSLITVAVLGALAAPSFVFAAEKEAKSDFTTSGSVGLFSQYIFRGLTQTDRDPALQGNFDINHTSGLYLGMWGSNVSWLRDKYGNATDGSVTSDSTYYRSGGNLEIDIYGGKRGEINGVSYDVGLIRYYYPSNRLNSSATVSGLVSANTTEVYGQLGYGPAYIKYSQAVTNFIGWGPGTDGSNYIDIGANQEIKDGYILNVHYGKQVVKNYLNGLADYSDWKVGVTKDFGLAVVAVAVVGTNADKTTSGYDFGGRGYLGGTAGVVTVTKTF
jgi:uncharacterized protein (TIGR02001 family)